MLIIKSVTKLSVNPCFISSMSKLLTKASQWSSMSILLRSCRLVRGSLFIELGCTRDLGKGWRGDLGTFMISRSI